MSKVRHASSPTFSGHLVPSCPLTLWTIVHRVRRLARTHSSLRPSRDIRLDQSAELHLLGSDNGPSVMPRPLSTGSFGVGDPGAFSPSRDVPCSGHWGRRLSLLTLTRCLRSNDERRQDRRVLIAVVAGFACEV